MNLCTCLDTIAIHCATFVGNRLCPSLVWFIIVLFLLSQWRRNTDWRAERAEQRRWETVRARAEWEGVKA